MGLVLIVFVMVTITWCYEYPGGGTGCASLHNRKTTIHKPNNDNQASVIMARLQESPT